MTRMFGVLMLALGCAEGSRVLVLIEADDEVSQAVDRLEASVRGPDGQASESAQIEDLSFPLQLELVPEGGDESRFLDLEVGLRGSDSLGTQRAVLRSIPEGTSFLRLCFTADCVDVDCPGRQTCRSGLCTASSTYATTSKQSASCERPAATSPAEPPAGRVEGAMALYFFDEREGASVDDHSGADPAADLIIDAMENVEWGDEGLSVVGDARIQAQAGNDRLRDALVESGNVTLEAWITPARAAQGGPGRVMIFDTPGDEVMLLGHGEPNSTDPRPNYVARILREGGGTTVLEVSNIVTTGRAHLVLTVRAGDEASMYFDGVEIGRQSLADVNRESWQADVTFGIGNRPAGSNRPWNGTYHLVAVYDRALSESEIEQNFLAGPGHGL